MYYDSMEYARGGGASRGRHWVPGGCAKSSVGRQTVWPCTTTRILPVEQALAGEESRSASEPALEAVPHASYATRVRKWEICACGRSSEVGYI